MRVKWLRKAALNLEDAHDFLSRENPIVAQEFVREVYRLVSLLSTQPAMGGPGGFLERENSWCSPIRSCFRIGCKGMRSTFCGYSTPDNASQTSCELRVGLNESFY